MTSESVEIESLRAKVATLKAQLAVKTDFEKQIAQLQGQVDSANKSMNEMDRVHNEAIKTLMKEHAQLVKRLRSENRELTSQIKETNDDRAKIRKELTTATKYMTELEERTLAANKRSLGLLKRLRDLELENQTLKNYIIDLKARVAVYVPIKSDPVDVKMAEFINNYPDRSKLKMMFMRDSSGVYEFGTKRVTVTIERGRIQIRTGGGFLSIDEFLDQFTPIELEKLERRDPLKRFSEKVALQKSIAGREVGP